MLGKPIREVLPELEGQSILEAARPSIREWTHLPLLRAAPSVSIDRGAPRTTSVSMSSSSPCSAQTAHTESIAFVATDVSELVRSREEARGQPRTATPSGSGCSPCSTSLRSASRLWRHRRGGCSSSTRGSARFTDRAASPRPSRPIARTGVGTTGTDGRSNRGMATLAGHPAWRNDRKRSRVDRACQGPSGRDHDQGRPHSQCPW